MLGQHELEPCYLYLPDHLDFSGTLLKERIEYANLKMDPPPSSKISKTPVSQFADSGWIYRSSTRIKLAFRRPKWKPLS